MKPTTTPSAIGTSTPSAGATPRATVKPTPSPTATPSVPLTLTITCASISIANGGDICIHTLPGASSEITAAYPSGGAVGYDYIYDIADDQDNYQWAWDIDTSCKLTPTASIFVLAYTGGQVAQAKEDVTVG